MHIFYTLITDFQIGNPGLWCLFLWKDITLGGSTASGIISVAIIYALSTVVRANGVRLEQDLLRNWGAFPSTIILRWRDSRLGKNLKMKYHQAVISFLGLPMPTEQEEATNAGKADELITQAFDRIRGVLRRENPGGLWATHNADYGFHRNLCGSRGFWLFISIIALLVSAIMAFLQPTGLILTGLGLNVAMLAGCLYMGWSTLPRGLQESAFDYAESAWESFLTISTSRTT